MTALTGRQIRMRPMLVKRHLRIKVGFMHQLRKGPRTYEHVAPEKIGNERHYLVSDQAGRSNMMARFAQCNIEIDPKDPRVDSLISLVKEKEYEGWAFDSAEASFELLARRTLGCLPDYFRIGRFRVMDERRFNARGDLVVESEATATIHVGAESFHEVAIGNGPVNAVDTAMRKALTAAYPSLTEVELVDYKVRILDAAQGSGTGAITRVLIEFRCLTARCGVLLASRLISSMHRLRRWETA